MAKRNSILCYLVCVVCMCLCCIDRADNGAPLASGPAVNWVPSRRTRLPLPKRYSASLPRRWTIASCRHQFEHPAAFGVDIDSARSTFEPLNNRWSGLPCGCCEGLKQSTAIDHVVAVPSSVQKGAEDGTVPSIVWRRTTLIFKV